MYTPADVLASHKPTDETLERLKVLEGRAGKSEVAPEKDADALLGTVQKPKRAKKWVSQAFALFVKEIAFDELSNKSDKWRYSWEKTKRTSTEYFIEFAGDEYMEEISRDQALSYRSWWMERMIPNDQGVIQAKPNTANRHIGNMRNLYDRYFSHIGEEGRLNPFRNMFFKDSNNDHGLAEIQRELMTAEPM